jgi:hypothetical protein
MNLPIQVTKYFSARALFKYAQYNQENRLNFRSSYTLNRNLFQNKLGLLSAALENNFNNRISIMLHIKYYIL